MICMILNIIFFQAPTEQPVELWALNGLPAQISKSFHNLLQNIAKAVTIISQSLIPISILIWVPICYDKTYDQSKLWRKRFISSYGFKGRRTRRGAVYCLILMACSVSFIIIPSTTSTGVTPTTLSQSPQSRKYSTILCIGKSTGSVFSIRILPTQRTLACIILI